MKSQRRPSNAWLGRHHKGVPSSMAFHGHGWPRPCVCVSLYYFVPSAQPNMVDHGSQPWKLAMPRDLHVPTEASRPIIDGNGEWRERHVILVLTWRLALSKSSLYPLRCQLAMSQDKLHISYCQCHHHSIKH